MTYKEAVEWVQEHQDDDELDQEKLENAFEALYERKPDYLDLRDGLWSMCCVMALDM